MNLCMFVCMCAFIYSSSKSLTYSTCSVSLTKGYELHAGIEIWGD